MLNSWIAKNWHATTLGEARKAEKSAGVKAEKICSQLFCYSWSGFKHPTGWSGFKYPTGWPALPPLGHDKDIGM